MNEWTLVRFLRQFGVISIWDDVFYNLLELNNSFFVCWCNCFEKHSNLEVIVCYTKFFPISGKKKKDKPQTICHMWCFTALGHLSRLLQVSSDVLGQPGKYFKCQGWGQAAAEAESCPGGRIWFWVLPANNACTERQQVISSIWTPATCVWNLEWVSGSWPHRGPAQLRQACGEWTSGGKTSHFLSGFETKDGNKYNLKSYFALRNLVWIKSVFS